MENTFYKLFFKKINCLILLLLLLSVYVLAVYTFFFLKCWTIGQLLKKLQFCENGLRTFKSFSVYYKSLEMEATLTKGSKYYIEKVLILSNFSLNCEKIVWRSCATRISLQNEPPRESSHEINCAYTRDTVVLSSWALLRCLSLHQYGRWMSSHSFFFNKDNVPSTCCQL